MAITLKNKQGLFLCKEDYKAYHFTADEKLAETFKDVESAEKLKAKLWNFKGLTINVPKNLVEVE